MSFLPIVPSVGTSPPRPVVSVIVTHYRMADALATCLASLGETFDTSRTEIVVCDSDAVPGTGTVVDAMMPSASYVPFDDNVGYAALVNKGLSVTSAPYILVLNADVRLVPGVVDELVRFLDANPDVGMVGPALVHPDGSHQHSAFGFYRPSTVVYRRTPMGRSPFGRQELDRFLAVREVEYSRSTGRPLDVDWLMGAAMMVRRAAVEQAGSLDEDYFLYFEDVDWCLRFWQQSWRVVYLPSVECSHGLARASKRRGLVDLLTNPLTRTHLKSAVRFFRKHGVHVSRPLTAHDVGGRRLDGRDLIDARDVGDQVPAARRPVRDTTRHRGVAEGAVSS